MQALKVEYAKHDTHNPLQIVARSFGTEGLNYDGFEFRL